MNMNNWSIITRAIVENNMEIFAATILEQRSDESLDTVLHLAIRYNRVELAAEILRLCPFMTSSENKKGETPLHEACRLQGDDKVLIMMLLERDPWVASKLNNQGQSALYIACCNGDLKAASIFLNQPWLQELDDDIGDGENASFLHVAAAEGHIAIVRKILETHPALAQKHDKNGYSPLHYACNRGRAEITAMLLRHYREQAFQFSRTGYAPVHLAAVNGSTKVLKELLSAAPTSFELLSRNGETVFHMTVKFDRFDAFLYLVEVLENRNLYYQPDKNGDTCLHIAINWGSYKIAEYIMREGGPQINSQNFSGYTAMDLLERGDNSSSKQNLKEILEAACAKRKLQQSCCTENINIPNPELSILGEPSHENNYLHLNLGTTSDTTAPDSDETRSRSQSPKISSPADNEVIINHGQTVPRFGEWSKKNSSKKRMQRHKQQSEKSRKNNLIKLYRKQHKRHEIYREALHNARETIILVAILIATITYTGGINPPGGVYQDGPLIGTATAARRPAFKVFSICNNAALFASLSIVIVLVSIIPFRRKPLMMMLMVAHKAMWVAVGLMAIAYSAASIVLMPPRHGRGMDWTVVSLLSISAGSMGAVFLGLGFLLMRHHFKKLRYRKKITDSPAKDADNSTEDSGQSSNSDMNMSGIVGYHVY